MSKYLDLYLENKSKKEKIRLKNCLTIGYRAITVLKNKGIKAEIFGSVARRDVREDSDIDFMIFNRNGYTNEQIFNIVEFVAYDVDPTIGIDVVFSDEIDKIKLEYMLNDRTST